MNINILYLFFGVWYLVWNILQLSSCFIMLIKLCPSSWICFRLKRESLKSASCSERISTYVVSLNFWYLCKLMFNSFALFYQLIYLCLCLFSGRCLPPIIIRDSSYYCICVAWELNKSDHWVSGSFPPPMCVENGCNFLPFKFRRNPFLCAKGL